MAATELTRNLERWIVLQVLDARWREHLDNMDYLRQGIGLRGYAQKDPLVEYRVEGPAMFDEMDGLVMQETVAADARRGRGRGRGRSSTMPQRHEQLIYDARRRARRSRRWPRPALPNGDVEPTTRPSRSSSSASVDPERDVGRNDPCWCGSGKKYKRCHGA